MAGLKKPSSCECGSKKSHREYHPERWVCDSCEVVIVSRGVKLQTGVCTVCGVKKEDGVSFKPGKNLCMEHYNQYMKDWYADNNDRELGKKKEYYQKNKVRIRERANAYWQGSIEAFMSDTLIKCRKSAKKRFSGKERKVPYEFDLDHAFLVDMFKKQNGKCALSGVEIVHKWGKLNSISVDRIDSSKGYLKDNVQLLAQFVNLGKGQHDNNTVMGFFEMMGVYD